MADHDEVQQMGWLFSGGRISWFVYEASRWARPLTWTGNGKG